MAARLPGASTVAEFWRNLTAGVESVRTFTDAELLAAGVAKSTLRDPRYVKAGVVLDGFDQFDAEFFGLSPKEAAIMDPQHRQFLECAWEALEDAAHPPQSFPGPIGVFAGCGMGAYFAYHVLRNRQLLDEVGLFLLRHTGNDKDFLATRASYCFDLRGPSVNVQTACSTSLVAIHQACQSLLSGECDMALAGGVTIEIPHGRGYHYAEGEILSPDGHCRAFDHRSKGTLFGSGTGVVVLRRLEDALRDRDHVYAVVRGSAVNNDGARKVGYLAPSVDGQAAAVAEAMTLAGAEPEQIGYVECHGTGTEIGDPIEVAALGQAFAATRRRQFCGIGSVKTNIGHLDTAAGVASFIKVCLALQHEAIPPTVNFEAPSPLIDFANSPFFVVDRLRPWPRGPQPRLAGVNSLGVGGTNAHVICAEAPPAAAAPAVATGPQLLVWSARNTRSLDDYARRLAGHLAAQPAIDLAAVASTLAFGRQAFARRRVAVVQDHADAQRVLGGETAQRVHTHTATDGAKVVFLLPGGGAQYRHMGRGLYAVDPVFRDHVDRGLAELQGRLDVDLREVWLGDALPAAEVEQLFDRPSVQLPAIFVLEYALAQSWLAKGVRPVALLGHSLGENTAACLAGVFSFRDALRLVTLRGQLFERVRGGGMLSVPLSAAECERRLPADLDLATVNAPGLCVVSGPDAALERFAAQLAAEGVEVQRVRINIAAHSRLLAPILDEFGAFLRSIELRPPQLPFVSNRTGTWITPAQATDPGYWVDHLRSTVRFAEGLGLLLQDPRHVFLEVGPGRTLSSLARQHGDWNQDRSAIPSLRHPEEQLGDAAYQLAAYGRLWAAGVDLPLDAVVDAARPRLSLPTYAWRHQRYWVDADAPGTGAAAADEAAERRDDLAQWLWLPRWSPLPPAPAAAPGAGTWLVFADAEGVAARTAARLRQSGAETVEVQVGDAYGRLADGRYTLAPEAGREGYDALLRDLAASGRRLQGVLHAWLLTGDRSHRPGSSFFHRCEEQGFYSLFFLAQALGSDELAAGFRLVVLTNDTMGPEGALACPEKATAIGPCLVMPRELQGLGAALVDVVLPQGPRRRRGPLFDELAAAVARELGTADQGLLALRGGQRFRLDHEAQPLPAPPPGRPALLRERGTYLITGGLGGVGSLVAEWLAKTCQARLVLVGRRELPPRDQWDAHLAAHGADDPASRAIQQVRLLESFGAEVLVGRADVADVVQMRSVVQAARQRFGAVHGVFHAAGVIQDELIAAKEQATIEAVLAPKVQGALVLEEVLAADQLDFLLLFSSTSALLGPPGQVDYVAANAFLNAFARRRSAAGQPTVAVQWGVWNRIGMTAAAGSEAGGGRPENCREPLFHELVRPGGQEVLLHGRLAAASTWMLQEHRTAEGHAVVPGTGYVEMAAEALAALGEAGPFEVRDLYFFRPLHVPDGDSRSLRVRLRQSVEGYEFTVQSESRRDDGEVGWSTHAQARLLLRSIDPPAAVDLAAVAARCTDVRRPADGRDWLPSPQEAHLRFGPRWRVVRELRYGRGEALARVELAAAFAADLQRFHLHPALLDLATGFAMELIAGYDGARLWVPLTYRSLRVFGRLPQRCHSWVSACRAVGTSGDIVAVDVQLCDDAGRVLVAVEGFQMKRLAANQAFALAAEPGRGGAGNGRDSRDSRGGGSAAEQFLAENVQKGILPQEGMAALGRLLSRPLPAECVLTPVPVPALLQGLQRLQAPRSADGAKFSRPELDTDYVAPRDELEQALVGLFEELLGIDAIGVHDDFFALGGHSLVAVRLFARLKKTFRVDYPMSVLFEAPTVDKLAALLRRDGIGAAAAAAGTAAPAAEAPRSRYRHLVAMHPSKHGDGEPFFLVAGMFGNVLNLRHLAQLAGADRPFYGLQARGLFGDMEPHATFEAAAADYLAEVRAVQPHGPYLLGGFSGGGITAYEMARQLRAAGEEVALLVLLDTPLPTKGVVGRRDRLVIQWQRLRRQGPGYLWTWLQNRVRWEVGKLQRRFGGAGDEPGPSAAAFHSQAIEAAFRAALGRYTVQPQPVRTVLFRPALDTTYDLGGGRFANKDRELVLPDNGWTPFLGQLDVIETPGDHDSMVLEPNVRTMAAALRQAFAAAVAEGRK